MYRAQKWNTLNKKSKYHSNKCEYNGHIYMSKFEAKYAQELDLRVKEGELTGWDRQTKIALDVNGYHICNYYIDFIAYYPDGLVEYIECKGFETDVWKMKWKLFEALYSEKENTKLTVVYLK